MSKIRIDNTLHGYTGSISILYDFIFFRKAGGNTIHCIAYYKVCLFYIAINPYFPSIPSLYSPKSLQTYTYTHTFLCCFMRYVYILVQTNIIICIIGIYTYKHISTHIYVACCVYYLCILCLYLIVYKDFWVAYNIPLHYLFGVGYVSAYLVYRYIYDGNDHRMIFGIFYVYRRNLEPGCWATQHTPQAQEKE